MDTLDYRADIYSFEAMTYHLLARELPFNRQNPGAKVIAHLMEPPPDISDKVSGLDSEVAAAIQQAMAKAAADRFETVDGVSLCGRAGISAVRFLEIPHPHPIPYMLTEH